MKSWRQSQILDVVDHEPVASQEVLRQRLQIRGIDATQATISRDLKDLGLVKRAGDVRRWIKSTGNRRRQHEEAPATRIAGASSSLRTAFGRKPPVTPGKKEGGAFDAPPSRCDCAAQVFWIATPELVAMSTPLVSRRNNDPTIRVITATPIGYQRPA